MDDRARGAASGHDSIVRELAGRCAEAGFDLSAPLRIAWYNEWAEGSLRLDDFGSGEHLGIVIGNTRALWPKFIAALAADAELCGAEHPLERYAEESISRAAGALGLPVALRWAHATGPHTVAIQRVAQVAGLAYLSESHLSVHETFGPWIALRAVATFPVSAAWLERPKLSYPCGSCLTHCLPAFERALAASRGGVDRTAVRANHLLWIALRDACPTGRHARYTNAQIRYHYLGDRADLLAAVEAARGFSK